MCTSCPIPHPAVARNGSSVLPRVVQIGGRPGRIVKIKISGMRHYTRLLLGRDQL